MCLPVLFPACFCGLTSLNRSVTLQPNRRPLDLMEGNVGTQPQLEDSGIWGIPKLLGPHYSFDVISFVKELASFTVRRSITNK